jgi:NitT/TauT family transport system substrate-binding protein
MTGTAISRAHSIALIAAGFGAATTSSAYAQEAAPVRIGFVLGDTFAQAIYGQQAGIFAKAGIDAQLTVLANAGAVAAAVAGGSLDVATGDIVSLSNAINHGVSVMLLAGGALYSANAPTTLLCVDGNSPIRTAKELEGKSIAVITLVGLGTASTKAWLAQNGADPSKVSFLELPTSSMQPALDRGQVAAAVIGEPGLTSVRDKIRIIGKPYDAIAKSFLISEWFTTPDWLAHNTAVAKRVVAAIYETARWANAHQEQTLPMLAGYLKLDPQTLHGTTRAVYATRLTASDIQPVIDVAVKYRAVERQLKAEDYIAKV